MNHANVSNYSDYRDERSYASTFLLEYFFTEKFRQPADSEESSIALINNLLPYNKNKIVMSTPHKMESSYENYIYPPKFTSYFESKSNRVNIQETVSISELNQQGNIEDLNIISISMKSKPEEILKSLKILNTNSFILSLSGKGKGPNDLARNKNKYY